ncbi:MAG TPA: hypothetical protein VMT76_01450 [Puia sp.]|nr:hypothetical protein [Puia sp.]
MKTSLFDFISNVAYSINKWLDDVFRRDDGDDNFNHPYAIL